nr:hypothetical protein [Hyphomonas sp. Mor2]
MTFRYLHEVVGAKCARLWSSRAVPTFVVSGFLAAACAGGPTAAEVSPTAFTGPSQCAESLKTIPASTSASGQYSNWAAACVQASQDSDLPIRGVVNALRNASKLYLAEAAAASDEDDKIALLNQAAEHAESANELLRSRPSAQSTFNEAVNTTRYAFDGALATAAPALAMGLIGGDADRSCGTKEACLSAGLAALEASEIAAVRPTLSDSNGNYQRAAAKLQMLNAKANATLAKTSDAGNVDRSLSVLKTVISMRPVEGNEALTSDAADALIKIAKKSAAREIKDNGEFDGAIRYLTEATQVAADGDVKNGLFLKLGKANEKRGDALLDNEDEADDASALTSYCDGARAYENGADHSDAEKQLASKEGYAYALTKLALAGSNACDASSDSAIAAFQASEAFRASATPDLTGHYKYMRAYGELLNRAEDYDGSIAAYALAKDAERGGPENGGPAPDPEPTQDDIRFAGGDPLANSQLVVVVRNVRDGVGTQAQINAAFAESQESDENWPTSYLEHGKYLSKTGDRIGSNGKLADAVRIARGNPEWSRELAEAYFELSKNGLAAGQGATAFADGAQAVQTNSSNDAFRLQACRAALYSEKGGSTAGNVEAYCPSADTVADELLLTTEEQVLNAFRMYRQAQVRRRANAATYDAFKPAEEAFRRLVVTASAAEDGEATFTWPRPTGEFDIASVATIGVWVSDACGSDRGYADPPVVANFAAIEELFTDYGLASCDGR